MDTRRPRSSSGRRGGATHASANRLSYVYAVNGWDTSTLLATASGAGVAGHATNGMSAIVLFYLTAVPSGTQAVARRSGTNQGWSYNCSGANLSGLVGNGSAGGTSPAKTLTSADVGKLHIACLTDDAAAVYQYFDNAQVGTSTALAGYSPVNTRHCLGTNITPANPAVDFAVVGHCGRDSHLTLADFQTICAATKAANDGRLALGGISMDHQWNAPTSTTVPATFTDVISAENMTFVTGSEANLVSSAYPIVWGF